MYIIQGLYSCWGVIALSGDITAQSEGKQGCTDDIIIKCDVVSTGPCMLVIHVLLASGVTYTHNISHVFLGPNKC